MIQPQEGDAKPRRVSGIYGFEESADQRRGWTGAPTGALAVDTLQAHSGRQALRLQSEVEGRNGGAAVTLRLPGGRVGQTIELRGWLKSAEVTGWFGLWLRLDGAAGRVGFESMQRCALKGSIEWTEYRITLALSPETRRISFGAMLTETGTLWVDDLSLWIDGKPWSQAPIDVTEPTILDVDTEFVGGSNFSLVRPSETQIDNIALLGRVWGFLKYHHQAVTDGSRHWDFDLFRILPAVAGAHDRAAACAILAAWIDDLGELTACDPCAEVPPSPAEVADLDWISRTDRLGDELAARLQATYVNRPADGQSFWVDFVPKVGNAVFAHEPAYAGLPEVDGGYRLLALFRFWNIVEYWCPNRNVIGEDWPAVLREFVPRLLAATEPDAYARELLVLNARINDTHAQLFSAWEQRPPGMAASLPVRLRWIENQPVVSGWLHESRGSLTGLQIGDVVLAVDGRQVESLFAEWRPYYSASNERQRLDDMAAALARGPLGACTVTVRRDGAEQRLSMDRMAYADLDHRRGIWHTLPGPAFRYLESGVAYMALDGIKSDSVRTWIKSALAVGAKGLIIDCRAYPEDFPVFELGGHLVDERTPFATYTSADPANPGAFVWNNCKPLQPREPHFGGPVVVLVDETSQSSAEYHALAFRAAPQAVVLGSMSSGADGNVSRIVLPGNLSTVISGIGIFDDEHHPTQRVGIVPDIAVTPTIAGIKSGTDEVLRVAIKNVLARAVQ